MNEELYNNAVIDFLEGKGEGLPKTNHCEYLIRYNKEINNFVMKSLKKKIRSISIMPYGDSIFFAENPIHTGSCTTTMDITTSDHKMLIHFDRN